MRKPNTAKAAPAAQDLRQRAARARDAAGRFNRRRAPAEAPSAEPDPALAVTTVFRASWDVLGKVLDAEAPDDLVAELEDAQSAAYDRLKAVRPTTPRGFRAVAECWAMVLKGHRGDEPGMTVSDHAADSLIAGAGVCEPPPACGAAEDTAFALIEAHQKAYAVWEPLAAAQNCARVGSPEYIAASNAEEGPRRAEVAAFNALFSARPSTLAGTLALAEYLQKAVRRAQIEPELDDGERALATVAAALRATVGLPQRHAAPNLVGLLDLASATTDDLQTLGELAERIGGVAYAHVWGPRCHRGTGPYGAPEYNEAGKLMLWLGDALTDVETAVDREVARRAPADNCERETRLSMRARLIIDNGDPEQIETFARELLDHASAGRKGR